MNLSVKNKFSKQNNRFRSDLSDVKFSIEKSAGEKDGNSDNGTSVSELAQNLSRFRLKNELFKRFYTHSLVLLSITMLDECCMRAWSA